MHHNLSGKFGSPGKGNCYLSCSACVTYLRNDLNAHSALFTTARQMPGVTGTHLVHSVFSTMFVWCIVFYSVSL